jgi:hypothetical protein
MRTSTIRVQLGAIDDGLLTTERSIQRLEQLIGQLGLEDEDRQEAQRQLVHMTGMRRRFEMIRASLVSELSKAAL